MQYTGGDGETKHLETVAQVATDTNIYCYRYDRDNPAGMRLRGIVLGNWEKVRLDVAKLSCYVREGEESEMRGVRAEVPPRDQLLDVYNRKNSINEVARTFFNDNWQAARNALVEAGIIGDYCKSDTLPTETKSSVAEGASIATETAVPTEVIKISEIQYAPEDNDFAEEPALLPPEPAIVKEITIADIHLDHVVGRARDKVGKVMADPVALALIKELISRGVA